MTRFICCPFGGLRGFPPFAIFPIALSNVRRRAPPSPEIDFRLRPFSGSPGRRRRSRDGGRTHARGDADGRSEEHTSELQSLMRISYAVFCLQKKTQHIFH